MSRRHAFATRIASRNLLPGALLVAAAVATAGAQPAATSWTPELQMTVKRVSAPIASPDGTQVAFVVGEAVMTGDKSEWLSHIHVARADGSDSRQLTRGEKSATSPRWSPDGAWVAFISSRGGKANVWRISLRGGEAEPVTDEKGGVSAFEWAPDGRSIAFVATDPKTEAEEKADKEKRDWRTVDEGVKQGRLHVQAVGGDPKPKSRVLTTASYTVTGFDWSPDGATIAFTHQPTPSPNDWTRSDLSAVTVADGAVRSLSATRAAEQSPRYAPDGRSIALVMSEDPPSWPGGNTVHVMPAAGGQARALPATPDQNANLVGWTADGARVIVAETARSVQVLYAVPVAGGAPTVISPAGLSVGSAALNQGASRVAFVAQDFDKAPEAFVSPLGDRLAPVQVSRVQPAIDAPIGRSEAITWKSTDGLPVEGLLTFPAGYQRGTRVPLLLVVHGGPAGVFVNSYLGSASQYPLATFASRGYAILRVNPRGSSGYGLKFRHANRVDWGGGDYRDLMTGVDHVVGMGVADADRMGVMGWSYGGFMTSWIVTQTKRFKAASAGAAVTNLISFTGTADIPDFIPDYFGGEFWNVFEAWRAHSPVLNAKGVATPTLIQHGDADLRVPVSQGYELYNALKRQGVTTKMTVYPRQPHGFTEPKMTLDAAQANLEWFDRHVLGRAASTSAAR